MKIDETPFSFRTAAAPNRQRPQGSVHEHLDDLDLSFLDLLNEINLISVSNPESAKPATSAKEEKRKTESAAQEKTAEKPSNVVPLKVKRSEETRTEVDKEMTLLKAELEEQDIQYLKQALIPNLPIITGSVPVQTVFPTTPEGEISYRGFELSPKLSELIEKGYKTGRPIRVELDPESAVVLKIRNGRVSAEFLSANQAAVIYLQQELDELRQRMAARNLPVDDLTSRQERHGRHADRQHKDEEAEQ